MGFAYPIAHCMSYLQEDGGGDPQTKHSLSFRRKAFAKQCVNNGFHALCQKLRHDIGAKYLRKLCQRLDPGLRSCIIKMLT